MVIFMILAGSSSIYADEPTTNNVPSESFFSDVDFEANREAAMETTAQGKTILAQAYSRLILKSSSFDYL
ncbi:MAG: hypothetical protein ACERKO_07690, partial [Acetanaerobacterium sp.]